MIALCFERTELIDQPFQALAVSDHYPIELSLQPAKTFPEDTDDEMSGCGLIDSLIKAFRRC